MARGFLSRLSPGIVLLHISLANLLPPIVPAQQVVEAAQLLSSNRRTATLEITRMDVFEWPFYFTSIALGTPPQAFQLVLDLELGCVAVRSTGCATACGRKVLTYNRSASSTCSSLDEWFELPLAGHYAQGPILQDNLQLVSLTPPNAPFGSMDRFDGENFVLSILMDFSDGQVYFR